jgi:hypothetical protein
MKGWQPHRFTVNLSASLVLTDPAMKVCVLRTNMIAKELYLWPFPELRYALSSVRLSKSHIGSDLSIGFCPTFNLKSTGLAIAQFDDRRRSGSDRRSSPGEAFQATAFDRCSRS